MNTQININTLVAVVNLNYLAVLQETYEDYLDTLEFDQTKKLKRIPLEEHTSF